MIHIDEDNLKHGVLGLVLAVVEILRDALQNQATRRIESGALTEDEVERLGAALADLDLALEGIKRDQGLQQAVQSVRDGLDDLVDDVVQRLGGSSELGRDPAGIERQETVGASR